MKIGIIGTGVYSTSIALTLASNKDNKIVLWSENQKLVEDYKKTKKLNTIFKDKTIPKNISVTNTYEEALDDAEAVFLVTGVEYLDDVCKEIRNIIKPEVPVCIGTKGIASDSKKFVHEIAHRYLKNKITIISGPTFAVDIANLDPVGFVVAGKDKKVRTVIKKVFDFDDVRIDETDDLNGIAVCACVKNIYALGAGILKGLGYNESTRALYLTEVYEELGNILYKFKSSLTTLNGLAGFGDLVLTCSSEKSRNFTYGEMIGKKKNKKDAKKYLEENTVEGVNTLSALYPILKRKHVKCPVMDAIYKIVYEDENPQLLSSDLTKKPIK